MAHLIVGNIVLCLSSYFVMINQFGDKVTEFLLYVLDSAVNSFIQSLALYCLKICVILIYYLIHVT
jgi:hypothetical protein